MPLTIVNKRVNYKMYTLKENSHYKQTIPHKTCSLKQHYLYSACSYIKTDFNLFQKCLMVLLSNVFLSNRFQEVAPNSCCTVRKRFLCFINTIILSISCWVIVCLNMFSKGLFYNQGTSSVSFLVKNEMFCNSTTCFLLYYE